MDVDPAALARDGRDHPAPAGLPAFGSRWARERRSCALRVPSALVPEERNWVLNPLHPDMARIAAGAAVALELDPRLVPV